MAEFGTIGTVEEIKKQLIENNKTYEGLKTWEEMFGSVSLMGKQAESAVTYDYAKAMSEAYASSLQADIDIMSSNLGQGYKQRELEENQLALEEAFKSYQQSYLENMQTVAESTAEAEANVNAQLETQSEYTQKLLNKPYEYLKYMYDTYKDNTELFNSTLWKRYLNEDGSDLKSWEEISSTFYDADNNLTIKGAEFYDQMLNQIASQQLTYNENEVTKNYTSFYEWLRTNDSELAEWYISTNPYDYAPNMMGQSLQSSSFRTLIGEKSYDEAYSFAERFGGMNKKEIDDMFNEFLTTVNTGKKDNIDNMISLIDNIEILAKDLGINDEFEKEFGSWENLRTTLSNIKGNIDDSFLNTNDYFGNVSHWGKNALKWGVNSLSWLVSDKEHRKSGDYKVYEYSSTSKEKDKNKAYVKQAEIAYLNMVNSLIEYAQSERIKKEKEFYNQ